MKRSIDIAAGLVCNAFKYDLAILRSRSRRKDVVEIRDGVVWALNKVFGFSTVAIGVFFNRDHSSISCSIKRAKTFSDKDLALIKGAKQKNSQGKPIVNLSTYNAKYMYERNKNHFLVHGAKCMVCGFDDVVEVHHIIPIKAGGSTNPSNTLVLCPNHHTMLHMGLLHIKDIVSFVSKKDVDNSKTGDLRW